MLVKSCGVKMHAQNWRTDLPCTSAGENDSQPVVKNVYRKRCRMKLMCQNSTQGQKEREVGIYFKHNQCQTLMLNLIDFTQLYFHTHVLTSTKKPMSKQPLQAGWRSPWEKRSGDP